MFWIIAAPLAYLRMIYSAPMAQSRVADVVVVPCQEESQTAAACFEFSHAPNFATTSDPTASELAVGSLSSLYTQLRLLFFGDCLIAGVISLHVFILYLICILKDKIWGDLLYKSPLQIANVTRALLFSYSGHMWSDYIINGTQNSKSQSRFLVILPKRESGHMHCA